MSDKLVEVEPGRWRFVRKNMPPARSELPCPSVISDEMDAVEQVDGRFYTSKAKFRAVGRANGLTEVGNEKFKPKQRATANPQVKVERRRTLERALAQYKAGRRPRRGGAQMD
jgi:hypothetical protein